MSQLQVADTNMEHLNHRTLEQNQTPDKTQDLEQYLRNIPIPEGLNDRSDGESQAMIEATVIHGGEKYKVEMNFKKNNNEDYLVRASIFLELFDKENIQAASFKATCLENRNNGRRQWQIFHHIVHKDHRLKGLGSLSLQTLIRLIGDFEKKYPDTNGQYIGIDTRLGAMARMIVDQDWLVANGLSQYRHGKSEDLHFLPVEEDAEKAIQLVATQQQSCEDESDHSQSGETRSPMVRFYRPMS